MFKLQSLAERTTAVGYWTFQSVSSRVEKYGPAPSPREDQLSVADTNLLAYFRIFTTLAESLIEGSLKRTPAYMASLLPSGLWPVSRWPDQSHFLL